jgi:hypothetical protein
MNLGVLALFRDSTQSVARTEETSTLMVGLIVKLLESGEKLTPVVFNWGSWHTSKAWLISKSLMRHYTLPTVFLLNKMQFKCSTELFVELKFWIKLLQYQSKAKEEKILANITNLVSGLICCQRELVLSVNFNHAIPIN